MLRSPVIRLGAFAVVLAVLVAACGRPLSTSGPAPRMISDRQIKDAVTAMVKTHGEAQRARIERGVAQVARFWNKDDGTPAEFAAFCSGQFISDTTMLDAVFARYERNLMLIGGYMTELGRDLGVPMQLDQGPILPVDQMFSEFSPGVHANDDFFKTKIAFTALLNFPVTTLEQRLKEGASWSRRQWAEARLAGAFSSRVPADANQMTTSAYAAADAYISSYNIHMHGLLDEKGQRPFPEGLKLISHWGLRDELKAQYDKEGGLARQRMIAQVMQHIIAQDIPKAVIDNPDVDWTPATNAVAARAGAKVAKPGDAPEPDTRYERWLSIFKAEKSLDPFFPDDPTFIARKFNREREIPETEVEALLLSVLQSPLAKQVGALVSSRLGRPLEPFDIWYNGFRAKSAYTEDELDRIVSKKYPTVASFQADLPGILSRLGFAKDKAQWLSQHITVDPARGSGHAMGAGRVTDNAHLRTRIPATGMNYKGYNIAIHELGHNVEQTFSYQGIDHTLLRGVPNTAFTEGFAFVFQSRDLAVLGLAKPDAQAEAMQALDVYWSTYEIAGVALVDIRTWHWLYDHPNATPAEMKAAVIDIAKTVWNSYYAPVFGVKDVTLLAIYSHLIDAGMYIPDYPMGHIIAFQVEQYMKTRNLATEMERMCTIGSVSPDLWMRAAVGAPISTKPLLDAAQSALTIVQPPANPR